MDSDTVDRQIQDLDTNYQNEISVLPEQPKSTSSDDFDILPQTSDIPWDKVQIIIYSLIFIIIILVVTSAVIFTLKKIQTSIQAPQPISETQPSENTVGNLYQNDLADIQLTYPTDWILESRETDWLQLSQTATDVAIDILLINSEAYLTRSLLHDVAERISHYCQTFSDETHQYVCDVTLTSDQPYTENPDFQGYQGYLSLTIKSLAEATSQEIPFYVLRNSNRDTDAIVIVSVTAENPHTIKDIAQSIRRL